MAHLLSVWLRLPIEWRWWWHCQEVLSKTKKTQFSVCVLANDDNQHDNERVTEWLSAFLSSPSSSLCICLLPLFLSLTLISALSLVHWPLHTKVHLSRHKSLQLNCVFLPYSIHAPFNRNYSNGHFDNDFSWWLYQSSRTLSLSPSGFQLLFCSLSKWQLSQWKSEQLPPAPSPQLYCTRWPDSDFFFFFFVLFLVTVNWLRPDEFADTAVHKPGKGVAV